MTDGIQELDWSHIIILLVLVGILVGTVWFFEGRPGLWRKVETKFPLLGFYDSHLPVVGGPPAIIFGRCPRDPTGFMIENGVNAWTTAIEEADDDDLEPKILIQYIWTEMWKACQEESQ